MSWYNSDKSVKIYKAGAYSVASVLIGTVALPLLGLAAEDGVKWAYLIPVVNVVLVSVKQLVDSMRGK